MRYFAFYTKNVIGSVLIIGVLGIANIIDVIRDWIVGG